MSIISSKIFAHRGMWENESEQNTVQAVLKAFLAGFNVEIDVRLNEDKALVTGHDKAQEFDWDEVMECPQRGIIAFHVKEKGLCTQLKGLIESVPYLDYLIFGVPEEEMDLYILFFGKDKVAFEYNAGDDFEKAFNCNNKILWVAELNGERLSAKEIIVLRNQDKKMYFVTQDCHQGDVVLIGIRLRMLQTGFIDGICSDNPLLLSTYA